MTNVLDLETAIARHVDPGDTVHVRGGYQFSAAAVYELTRQFWERSLDDEDRLTLTAIGTSEWAGPLVHAGAVDSLVTSFAGFAYPAPNRHPVIQTHAGDDVAVEHWSYLTLIERWRAAALGLPFHPTNSLAGSDVGPDSEVATIANPFENTDGSASGETLVVSALEPDVSLLHGVVAGPDGTVAVSPIRAEGPWGTYASDTVVATVERVVDEHEFERYNHQATVPGCLVDAVVETPFGAHPSPLYNPLAVGGVESYDYDREFYMDLRAASRSTDTLEEWVDNWVLDTDWDAYLDQLGEQRLAALELDTTVPDRDPIDSAASVDTTTRNGPPTPEPSTPEPSTAERLLAWAAGEVAERVDRGDHDVVFGGIGVSHLATWLYRTRSQQSGREPVPLFVESGAYDFEPPQDDAFIFTPRALPSAGLLADTTFGLGQLMQSARTLGVLTAAQVDRHGNVNSTRLGGEHFVGSGGANDALSNADEVVLVVEASPQRLVEDVEYVTAPGRNVSTVVTQYGRLHRHDDELRIDTVYLRPDDDPDERRDAFRDAVGWDVALAPEVDERRWNARDDRLVEVARRIDTHGDYR